MKTIIFAVVEKDKIMKKRFAYFYFMKDDPGKIQQAVPSHIEYWKERNLPNYLGGPFADRSGGLISFEATSLEEATQIIMAEPLLLENLVENKWIKEWIVE